MLKIYCRLPALHHFATVDSWNPLAQPSPDEHSERSAVHFRRRAFGGTEKPKAQTELTVETAVPAPRDVATPLAHRTWAPAGRFCPAAPMSCGAGLRSSQELSSSCPPPNSQRPMQNTNMKPVVCKLLQLLRFRSHSLCEIPARLQSHTTQRGAFTQREPRRGSVRLPQPTSYCKHCALKAPHARPDEVPLQLPNDLRNSVKPAQESAVHVNDLATHLCHPSSSREPLKAQTNIDDCKAFQPEM